MTPLGELIYRDIETNGPINLAQYMVRCLCHPVHGYYMKKDPLGVLGDFTTAPEISQAFGEMIGLWACVFWQQMGAPSPFKLVELGPGRATLMADALRATRNVPGFHEALELHLVEVSPTLKALQKEKLSAFNLPVYWQDAYDDVPEGAALFLANEFFDALPIRQFEYGEKGWAERFIDIVPDEKALRFVLKPDQAATALMPPSLKGQDETGLFEISTVAQSIALGLGQRIRQQGGGVLVVDYGHVQSGFGDTFQALKNHRSVSVLEEIGDADLTAHVDFEMLLKSFQDGGALTYSPLDQGTFLELLGITQRVQNLYDQADEDQKEAIFEGHKRLCHPDEMGHLFKVACVTGPDHRAPIGFEGRNSR